ncbi:hypothetical protein [Snodgrassella sp. ESL0253]|uniref:hypothetical protein n=1 Tax=Snodgrassella sp. ESL0253 TaxID=2705031 RepID=UPI0015836DD8|nr:hypothetical protein [Snodgrassella sp. ESL0253]NUE67747.1 hypothetical protein [Snodgrassella sp. ESL0253]
MRKIKDLWKKYEWIVSILIMICWFSIFKYVNWVEKNGKFGYELDNDEKEAIMMKQLPELLHPFVLNKNFVRTKRGGVSKIYIMFEFKHDDYKSIKKLYNTIDRNSPNLGFKDGCRGKEMITVSSLDDYYIDPTVIGIQPKRYAVRWEYPNTTCTHQSQRDIQGTKS